MRLHLYPSIEQPAGTATNLHAYDLEKNQDVFFKEVSDGVTAIVVGHFGHATGTAVIVGGNCSVQVNVSYPYKLLPC